MIKYLLCKVQWHLYLSSVIHCASPSIVTTVSGLMDNSAGHLDSHSLPARTKRRASNHSGLKASDDDYRKKIRKVKTEGGVNPMIMCRFACPFYKHDSQLYGSRRSCLGPGWPTVRKMK